MTTQTTTPKTASKTKELMVRFYALTVAPFLKRGQVAHEDDPSASAVALYEEEMNKPRSYFVNPFFSEAACLAYIPALRLARKACGRLYGVVCLPKVTLRGVTVFPIGPTPEKTDLQNFAYVAKIQFPSEVATKGSTYLVAMICYQKQNMLHIAEASVMRVDQQDRNTSPKFHAVERFEATSVDFNAIIGQ